MPTTREDINHWITMRPDNTLWMIVATDTFDWTDYPIYCPSGESLQEHIEEIRGMSLGKIMEIYSFTGEHTIEDQLNEFRAWHVD